MKQFLDMFGFKLWKLFADTLILMNLDIDLNLI